MSLWRRLEQLEKTLPVEAPAVVSMTEEERALALQAIAASVATQGFCRPVPEAFKLLPAAKQLAAWQAAKDRGDFFPAEFDAQQTTNDATPFEADLIDEVPWDAEE